MTSSPPSERTSLRGRPRSGRGDDGPGVPEAIPRTLQGAIDRLGAESVDRIWVFPPRIKGRKESGLIVVSRFAGEGRGERRDLFTASYAAERTGRGLTVDWALSEEGTAPPDRLPPVMEGVMRRSGDSGATPREFELRGDLERIEACFGEWEESLLEPTLWPRAPREAEDSESNDHTEPAEEADSA